MRRKPALFACLPQSFGIAHNSRKWRGIQCRRSITGRHAISLDLRSPRQRQVNGGNTGETPEGFARRVVTRFARRIAPEGRSLTARDARGHDEPVGAAVDLRRDLLGRPAALTFEVLSRSRQPTGGQPARGATQGRVRFRSKRRAPDPDDFRQDLHGRSNRPPEQHLQANGPQLTRSARESAALSFRCDATPWRPTRFVPRR